MKKITYSDVEKRQHALSIKDVVPVAENSKLYYNRLEARDTLEYAQRFVTECAKDSKVASYYMEDLQRYTDKYYSDPTIKSVFENHIIPMITLQKGDTILEGHGWEDLFKRNQICDRIIDNMQLIESKMPIDAITTKRGMDTITLATLCSEAVCDFKKLDLVAKVNIAIEEAIMIAQKHNIEVMEEALAAKIIGMISIMENTSKDETQKMVFSLINSPVAEYEDVASLFKSEKSNDFISAVREFKENMTVENFGKVIDECFKPAMGVHAMVWLVQEASLSSDDKIVTDIFGTLQEIPERFIKKFANVPKGISLYKHLSKDMCDMLQWANNITYPLKKAGSKYIEKQNELVSALEGVIQKLDELDAFIYPEYNMRMIQEGVFSTAKGVISMIKASEKLGGIVNKLLQARKWIKGKAQPMRVGKQITDVVKTVGSNGKMLTVVKKAMLKEDASIYEYLTPEGNFDAIVERFVTVDLEPINSSVLETFDNICREMNDNIFHTRSSGCGTYFLASENMIEIHYFDNERVDLTEEQTAIVTEQTMDMAFDMPLIYEFALYSSMPDDICELNEEELIKRASDTLLMHREATENDFGTFLELAAQATIWYDTVNKIFESVCELMPATFRTSYQYAVESYRPQLTDDELELEALDFFKDFISEKVNYDEKYGDLLNDDEEKTDDSEDGEESPEKEARKKINPGKEKDKKKEKPEKEEKIMSFNNIKLFQMGLKKKMKDLSAKEQGFSRNLDSSFTRLVKSMQQALVSDKRESIIKGSVIPSLSKSIKWGCVLAGTAIINPIAPVVAAIGAFAMSKKLTKKERTLLLDDIEIELKVIDKEIGIAESDNNTKKMRALMKEQRNLQRQYQRIKYNIRVGKDIIPGGTTGGGND